MGFTAPVPMPATASCQSVLAEGVPQSGVGWLHCPSTHGQVWILLVSWACHTRAQGCRGALSGHCSAVQGRWKGLIKPELPKT